MDTDKPKRKLSPSPSSRSSPTPVPTALVKVPSNPASPAEFGLSDDQALNLPGPSRTSHSLTPAPVVRDEQMNAKAATLVPGSGDGTQFGDECFAWTDLPMNKGGFRYLPCKPSPNPSPSPLYPFYRTLPGPSSSPPIHISWLDRSSFLRLSVDGLTASTDRGYRSGRANVSVREGSWYYEVKIERGSRDIGVGAGTGGDAGNAHVRIGWGRREANLDAPVGLDAYSYGIRDTNGEKIHISRPKPYGKGFGTGDTIGCLITLPPRPVGKGDDSDPATIKRKRIPILYKGQRYFEMDEYSIAKEMEALVDREGKGEAAAKAAALAEAVGKENDVRDRGGKGGPKDKKGATTKNAKKGKSAGPAVSGSVARPLNRLTGSSISFYLNGEPLGEAFDNLFDFIPLPPIAPVIVPGPKRAHSHPEPGRDVQHDDGTLGYFPVISCFAKGKVRCNFGPNFAFPPASLGHGVRGYHERWDEFREEEKRQDEVDEEEEGVRVKKEMADDEVRRKGVEARLASGGGRGVPGKRGRKSGPGKRKKAIDGTAPEGTPQSEISTPPHRMSEDGTPIKVETGAFPETPASPTVVPGFDRGVSEVSRVGTSMPPSDRESEAMDVDGREAEMVDDEMGVDAVGDLSGARDSEEEEEEEEEKIEW